MIVPLQQWISYQRVCTGLLQCRRTPLPSPPSPPSSLPSYFFLVLVISASLAHCSFLLLLACLCDCAVLCCAVRACAEPLWASWTRSAIWRSTTRRCAPNRSNRSCTNRHACAAPRPPAHRPSHAAHVATDPYSRSPSASTHRPSHSPSQPTHATPRRLPVQAATSFLIVFRSTCACNSQPLPAKHMSLSLSCTNPLSQQPTNDCSTQLLTRNSFFRDRSQI